MNCPTQGRANAELSILDKNNHLPSSSIARACSTLSVWIRYDACSSGIVSNVRHRIVTDHWQVCAVCCIIRVGAIAKELCMSNIAVSHAVDKERCPAVFETDTQKQVS